MLKRQNIKSKIASGGSCLLLLLLAFSVLNPITPAYAENVNENNTANATDTTVNTNIELYTAPSTISIAFSPASGSASLSPSAAAEASAQINVLATVSVQNSDGYSVYLKGNSANLIGKNSSSNIIPGATTAKTYANMDVNTWGYNATEGTTVPTNATYKAVTVSTNGEKIAENTNKQIESDTKQIMLSFAAKINDTKPADTYQNTITMSVVSSPLQTTLSDLTNMQDMNTNTCAASATYETKQLKDTRDGKYYWVTKLADGKCWMTQNLALDLSTTKALTSADSDVTSSWTPSYTTATTVSGSTTLADNTGQRSWNLGSYYIKTPNSTTSCGSQKASLADCTAYFTALATPTSANGDANAHYLAGNYYQWNAATAGTGGTITNSDATNSICPKGWKLPTSGAGNEFQALMNTYNITSDTDTSGDTTALVSAPLYFVRSGAVYQSANLFDAANNEGYYWSSTPAFYASSDACVFTFYGTNYISPFRTNNRQLGFSVRCITK